MEKILDEYYTVLEKGGFKILDKVVYKFSGDAINFLNTLTSNNITKERPKNAFVDRFGKLVVLCDQLVDGEEVYVIFDRRFEDRLREYLSNFLKLGKTRMEKTGLKVAHVIANDLEKEKINKLYRMIIDQRIGFLVLSYNIDFLKRLKEIPEEVYNIIRIENNISVQGIDFDQEMLLNTNWEEAVSFTKGCFLGQEIIGRVHNLGKPPKKLVRILYERVPDKITLDGQEIGKISSICYSPKYKKYMAFSMIPSKTEKIDGGKIIE